MKRSKMTTQTIIQSLCDELKPVRRGTVERQIRTVVALGGALSLLILVETLGIQVDLTDLNAAIPFTIKIGYALTLAIFGIDATIALARPGGGRKLPVRVAFYALIALALLAVAQLSGNAKHDAAMLLGASWRSCSLRIAALSLPITLPVTLAVRAQAPVRLRKAGAALGLTAGAVAAAIYALACAETSVGFILLWYSLGIATSGAIGAVLGPSVLRW
jgi:hypothetical protein